MDTTTTVAQIGEIVLCTWHEDGLHEQCTARDLQNYQGTHFARWAICPACRKSQLTPSCAAAEHCGS